MLIHSQSLQTSAFWLKSLVMFQIVFMAASNHKWIPVDSIIHNQFSVRLNPNSLAERSVILALGWIQSKQSFGQNYAIFCENI